MKHLIIGAAFLFLSISLLAQDNRSAEGTVAETMDVGAYVYLLLEENGTWVASSKINVKVGDRVQYTGGNLMKDFYSPKLDRTFENIIFVDQIQILTPNDPHGNLASVHEPAVSNSKVAATPTPGEIGRLDDGKTIEEIYASFQELEGKTVALRARVVKVSPKILGRNWVTLQDGTGKAPDNKLITTGDEVPAVGEEVVAKGVIRNNVDLGSGYSYTVLLEETTFER